MSECIVITQGKACELIAYPDTPKIKVLVFGDKAQRFPNRRAAHRAIQRTVKYAEKYDLKAWPKKYEYEVVNLTSEAV